MTRAYQSHVTALCYRQDAPKWPETSLGQIRSARSKDVRAFRRLLCACLLQGSLLWATSNVSVANAQTLPAQGEESEELRALRLAELDIFPHTEPLVDVTAPGRMLGVVPDALTSEVRGQSPSEVARGSTRDLSWLEGLRLPDIPVRWDDRVIRYLEFFRDDPRGRSIIRSWMVRVERYGALIRRTLREEGLPEDLLYLAMIESGFDPRAHSDAGAVGLWQFVSGTGAEYGLQQTHWMDQRMDPVASTRAGAQYLEALHTRFGTWELAFASYNMGYGAMLRSMRKYGTNDFWLLSRLEAALPYETSLYVAKVMACAIVGRNLERFGMADLAREPELAWDEVQVPGGTTFAQLARATEATTDDLRRLNPALRRDRTPPASELFTVLVPAGGGARFAERWSRVRPGRPAHAPYVTRMGEDLAAIALRFNTTEAVLREINQLSDRDFVRPGFDLMVPAVAPRGDSPSEPPTVVVPERTFAYEGRRRVFYRVARGDTLAEIARFFRVSASDVRAWNEVDPRATLQDGLFLQLFVAPEMDTARAVVLTPEQVHVLVMGSEEFYEHHVRQEGRVRLRVRVREGDTLSTIATRYGLSVGSVCRINVMPRDATLAIGQELIVYTSPDRVPREMRGQIEPEPATTPAVAAPVESEPEVELEAPELDAELPAAEESEAR